jgi:hypothetical protein
MTDSSHRIEELVDVANATLEHVAGPAAAREQRHRVLHLHACRSDQERGLRELFAAHLGCRDDDSVRRGSMSVTARVFRSTIGGTRPSQGVRTGVRYRRSERDTDASPHSTGI